MAGCLYLLSWRRASDAGTLSEAWVRHTLQTELAAEVEWDEIALSFDPPSVTLGNLRVEWNEASAVARSARVGLQHFERLELASVRFEGLRIELPESRPAVHRLAGEDTLASSPVPKTASWVGLLDDQLHQLVLSHLEVERIAPERQVVSAIRAPAAASLAFRGGGQFEAGGALRFEGRSADQPVAESSELSELFELFELDVHFERVPAAAWALLVPELRDATGTISGRVEIGQGRPDDEGRSVGETSDEISRARAATPIDGPIATPIDGRFEIDATQAGLSIAGAYRKPTGDPATLRGRFTRSQQGEFELVEVHLSVHKASVHRANARSAGSGVREPR